MNPKPKKRATNDTQITLGEGWRQFAQLREDLTFMGVIRRGMEIGALAKDASGAYLQVNGDIRQVLNSSRVEAKLRSAVVRQPPVPVVRGPTEAERAAVVVVVKQRRRIVMPTT
jgi:predicted nucleotidyltransferase